MVAPLGTPSIDAQRGHQDPHQERTDFASPPALPEHERTTVEDAARELRKARSAAAFIPMDGLTIRRPREQR
ncbi:hypothetical protein ACWKT3_16630 [Streptomyces violaceus]